jgi:hypothetical protein
MALKLVVEGNLVRFRCQWLLEDGWGCHRHLLQQQQLAAATATAEALGLVGGKEEMALQGLAGKAAAAAAMCAAIALVQLCLLLVGSN